MYVHVSLSVINSCKLRILAACLPPILALSDCQHCLLVIVYMLCVYFVYFVHIVYILCVYIVKMETCKYILYSYMKFVFVSPPNPCLVWLPTLFGCYCVYIVYIVYILCI